MGVGDCVRILTLACAGQLALVRVARPFGTNGFFTVLCMDAHERHYHTSELQLVAKAKAGK
jgi:hypothetical protein